MEVVVSLEFSSAKMVGRRQMGIGDRVEHGKIIDNIDAILQVPGLGGLLIGPADLSMALGVGTSGPNPSAPEVLEAIAKVGAACKRHNALCGIYMRSDVEERQEQGFMLFPSIAY